MIRFMIKTGIEKNFSHTEIIRFGEKLPEILSFTKVRPRDGSLSAGYEDSPRGVYCLCYAARGWQTWRTGSRYVYLPEDHFLLIKGEESFSAGDKVSPDSLVYLLRLRVPESGEEAEFLGFTREERGGLFLLLNEMPFPVIRTKKSRENLMSGIYRSSKMLSEPDREKPVLTTIRIKNLLRELLLSLSEGEPLFGSALDNLIDSILPRLPEGGHSPLIDRAISHMAENLYDGLTLVSLADDVNISLSRFKARFKEETGLTPLDYYTRLSIQKSLVLLHRTDKPVKSISDDLGFSSSRYFATLFRKTVGMGPDEFREWKGRSV